REDARVAGDAGVRRVDPTALRAGVPLVDRVVVLHAGVGAAPRRVGDLVPEVARLERLRDLAGRAVGERPLAVLLDGLEELVGNADGVVRVLPADGVVRLAVEVVVELEAEPLGR